MRYLNCFYLSDHFHRNPLAYMKWLSRFLWIFMSLKGMHLIPLPSHVLLFLCSDNLNNVVRFLPFIPVCHLQYGRDATIPMVTKPSCSTSVVYCRTPRPVVGGDPRAGPQHGFGPLLGTHLRDVPLLSAPVEAGRTRPGRHWRHAEDLRSAPNPVIPVSTT